MEGLEQVESSLPTGIIVGGKYEILGVRGRWEQGIAYEAAEMGSSRNLILREFFPTGAIRDSAGIVRLKDRSDESAVSELVLQAERAASEHVEGMVRIVGGFKSFGTAYVAVESNGDFVSLRERLGREKRLGVAEAVTLLREVSAVVERLHHAGRVHLCVNPASVLICGSRVLLRERTFGDEANRYASLEQVTGSSEATSASDVYSICATFYEAITGVRAPSSPDRVGGMAVKAVALLNPEVPPHVCVCIERGLALHSRERPQTIRELVRLLDEVPVAVMAEAVAKSDLDEMDQTVLRIRALKTKTNSCPSCGFGMDRPKKPLTGVCPVCREGRVLKREINERLCAVCRSDLLKRVSNSPKIAFCPICRFGGLMKRGVVGRALECADCGAKFSRSRAGLTLEHTGATDREAPVSDRAESEREYWLPLSGRAEAVWVCQGCDAQFDEVEPAKWRLVHAPHDPHEVTKLHQQLAPWEWARVARRLPIDCGNAGCEKCSADYFVDTETLTLLGSDHDPYGFASEHLGEKIPLGHVAWMAAGKPSGEAGLICRECLLEFNDDGDYLRLAYANDYALAAHLGDAYLHDDWHRIAKRLPVTSDEPAFFERLQTQIITSLLTGETEWADAKGVCRWRSDVAQLDWEKDSSRVVSSGFVRLADGLMELKLGRNVKKAPLDAVLRCELAGENVELMLSGEKSPLLLKIIPTRLVVDLESGKYEVELGAKEFLQCVDNLKSFGGGISR